ncbi:MULTISPECIES: hypothetical protein [unclassified Bradyrhizobium]|uniref:hypothetical protein n=1 Tax=unclassified Bradyrhizobium TaxID=2631580 RepID=UPI0028E2300E|nr:MULTISPECIES: hypothetical protein [unclassified Bradyrhizobium]
MIVTVYVDESGAYESGYTILGGLGRSSGQWAGFDPKWKALLKRSHLLTYFHSKKLRQSNWPCGADGMSADAGAD